MLFGSNALGGDVFASSKDNEERQIWTVLCKPQDSWSIISKIEPLVKECKDAN